LIAGYEVEDSITQRLYGSIVVVQARDNFGHLLGRNLALFGHDDPLQALSASLDPLFSLLLAARFE